MIKIHDKLWVAINPKRDSLAYMTYYEDNSAFEKRKRTGLGWAGIKEEYAKVFDNSPTSGFVISESVFRWSTQNKVFRVKDTRGFTVEVPTGNISTLLGITTVFKGEVLDQCVWGRDGNNHILLPVNSDEYKKAAEDTKKVNDRVSIASLNKGDVVTFNIDRSEYVYLGKYKCVWSVKTKKASVRDRLMYYDVYIEYPSDEVLNETTFTDTKWRHTFKRVVDKNDYSDEYQMKASGKCFKTPRSVRFEDIKTIKCPLPKELDDYLFENRLPTFFRHGNPIYTECEVIDIIKKD